MKFSVLLTFVVFALQISVTRQGSGEKALLNYLFQDGRYNPLVRPVRNDKEAVKVQFGVTLQQIIDVDEKNQIIKTNIWLNLAWSDYRLKWDDKNVSNVGIINLPVAKIWRPDILMYNSADEAFDSTYASQAVIRKNGGIIWIPPGMFKSTCNIDIKLFPFDEQACDLKFRSWAYDDSKLDLELSGNPADLTIFIKNGEWDLIDLVPSVNKTENRADLIFTIKLLRRPLYYTFNLIIPTIFLSSIAFLTFTLPVDAGEKISLGVTIVLSLTVFLMLIAEAMPPTSDAIPLIGIYFAWTMLLCSLSVFFTVLVLNFHNRRPETHSMPRWIKVAICHWLAWLLGMERPGHDLSRKGLLEAQAIQSEDLNIEERSSKSLLANVLDIDDDLRGLVSDIRDRLVGKDNEFDARPGQNGDKEKRGRVTFRRDTRASETKNSDDENLDVDPLSKSTSQSEVFVEARQELATILRELRIITNKMRDDEKNDEECSEWQFAAMVIDRFCLYVFVLTSAVSTTCILLSSPFIFKSPKAL